MPALILPYRETLPQIDPTAFVAETAVVIGDVTLGPDSGLWYGCVVRGDVNTIRIGARTNIQDGTVIHVSSTLQGTEIGDDITVGHMALLHACTLESGCFIGMKACVMDGAYVESGAMVAAGPDGLIKQAYRKFTIRNPEVAGDDFGMMREVFQRRFARALKEDPEGARGSWPDLVLIDGGQGQLSAVQEVLAELGIDDVALVAIAKGPDRNAGRERFFLPGREPVTLDAKDPVLYYLQRLRDEAHRFAIGTHRAKRAAALVRSELDEIPGIGPGRKKALLHHFGSARAVAQAGLADLEGVAGISQAVARRIHAHFHPEG